MADDKIALSIEIEADRAQMSLGELEQGFDGLKEQLKATNRGTEEGRKAFKELSGQMALTSKEIKNIELGFEGLDSEGVASEFGGLAGGIGDVTASLVLMGGENETIEQMGASIEKAMAISMGFKGVIEGTQAGLKLYNNVVKNSTLFQKLNNAVTVMAAAVMKLFKGSVDATSKSFKTLKTAIASTGIGLLVVGVAALVANFDKIKDALSGVATASKQLQDLTKLNVEINQKNLESIDNQTNSLRLQGYTEREIIVMKLDANKKIVTGLLAQLDGEILINKEKVDGAKRNQKILKGTLDFLFTIPRTLLKIFDYLGNSITSVINSITQSDVGQMVFGLKPITMELGLSKAADDLLDKATRMIFDPEGTESAGNKELEILRANLEKQNNEIAGHQLSLQALDKKGKEESSKSSDEAAKKAAADAVDAAKLAAEKAAADIALEKEKIKLLEDLEAKAIEDKNVRALAELELAQEREREALIEKFGLDTELLLALTTEQELAMVTLIADIEKEARDTKAALDQEARDKETAAKQAQRDKDFALASASIGALSALNKAATDTALLNAAGDEEKKEKIRKASFEREKKLNIAMALINGAQAVLAGFASGGLPMAIVAGVTAAAQLAAIVATTYQGGGSVKEVDKTAPVEPSGPDAGAGAQINAVTNTSTILGNQQVYVTETDITTTQNNVSVIEESATF